jgi:DNA invertase Pin-like site-specific DNA recombinase
MIMMSDSTPPHCVYGYTRISLPRPEEEGLSLDAQTRRITKRAEEYEWPLTEIFVEPGITARIPWCKRPQGHKLFARLQPNDVVIVACLDRCFRSVLDALTTIEDFRARGIRLLALDFGELTEEGVCELIVTILAAVAEFERELDSERVRAIKQHLRSQGKNQGRVDFGYRTDDNGYLVPIPEQLEMIDYMYARAAGGAGSPAIKKELKAQYGFAPSTFTIARIIKHRRANPIILAPHILAGLSQPANFSGQTH